MYIQHERQGALIPWDLCRRLAARQQVCCRPVEPDGLDRQMARVSRWPCCRVVMAVSTGSFQMLATSGGHQLVTMIQDPAVTSLSSSPIPASVAASSCSSSAGLSSLIDPLCWPTSYSPHSIPTRMKQKYRMQLMLLGQLLCMVPYLGRWLGHTAVIPTNCEHTGPA